MSADLFSIGRSALNTSKKSLATTSHNIANANTEGFSRQRVTSETNTPVGEGQHVFGTGVNIRSVKRVHDQLLENKLNRSITDFQFNDNRSYELGRIEEIFNEINSEGFNKILNRFFNSFRELANQPENETVRAVVRDNARLVVSDFKRLNEELRNVQINIDKKLDAAVLDINTLADTITKLNTEITRLENTGGETGDLRDQRDNALRGLSEYFAIHSYEDEQGKYVVNIKGVGTLLSGGRINKLSSKVVVPKDSDSSDAGKMQIFFESKPNMYITSNFRSGKIAAITKTRDEDLQELQDHLNDLAYGLAKSTNAIHQKGYINGEILVDEYGQPTSNQNKDKITGINFFKDLDSKTRAAEYIDLSSDVKKDLNNIATGLTPNSPGDNRIAIGISKLQHEKVLNEGTTSFEETYLQAVGKIGLRTSKSKIDTEQTSGILAQAKSLKERVSGVSIDEETANMVRFQNAYNASAKVLKTADEMFDTVIEMVR